MTICEAVITVLLLTVGGLVGAGLMHWALKGPR